MACNHRQQATAHIAQRLLLPCCCCLLLAVCPDGTGSWADQTYETLAGFPASAPNCGVLPAEACTCQTCPEGYAQAGASSIPDAVCKPVPVDCVATYEDFADCPAESCQPTLTQTANLAEITTEVSRAASQLRSSLG